MHKPRFDITFVGGLAIASVCILGGLVLEKGSLRDVGQITAALIVLGGTCGAVVVSTPQSLLLRAVKRSASVLWSSGEGAAKLLEDILKFSATARRSGPASLEADVAEVADPFFKKAMTLLVDGFNAKEIRGVLELDLVVSEQEADNEARVFDTAGGYAPTIGIIGAVLGLMQVMKHLDSIQDVGRGIAVAFVATVYGVGLANLVLLPIGSKMRTQARMRSRLHEMIIEGVVAIQEGKNPRLIREMLLPFVSVRDKAEAPVPRPAVAYARKTG